MAVRIIVGNCLDELRKLPDDSVQTNVSSPPYWGLRDYGLDPSIWGGDPECDHEFLDDETITKHVRKGFGLEELSKRYRGGGKKAGAVPPINIVRGSCCKCGAWRGVLGLEPTPEMFCDNMVEVYEEVRRVLRPDGVAWVNMGDCYATGAGAVGEHPGGGTQGANWRGRRPPGETAWAGYRGTRKGAAAGKHAYNEGKSVGPMTQPNRMPIPGLKAKDLVGVPWMLAFALRRAGWYLRQDIIWQKPNPMPESTEDRCTKAHEYVFLLSKSERYFYDAEAIKEPAIYNEASGKAEKPKGSFNSKREASVLIEEPFRAIRETRNKRSVWTVATVPFKGAHFATFPPDLIEPCVLAGTSERGACPICRSPWARILAPTARYAKFLGRTYFEHPKTERSAGEAGFDTRHLGDGMMKNRLENRQNAMIAEGIIGKETETIGWYPTCRCDGLQQLPQLPPTPRMVAENPDDPTPEEEAAHEVAREGWRVACTAVHEARRRLCEPAAKLRTVPCVVLDHFGGAGTTGLVADRAQRDAILIEMNQEYAEMARRRIEGDGGLFSRVAAE